MDLEAIKQFAEAILQDDTTGHDWHHALRVEKNARLLSDNHFTENELEIILAASWLHDTIDEKLAEDKRQTPGEIRAVLAKNGASASEVEEILFIIQNLSYSRNLETKRELSVLGQIVQDSDRLDALGAIGIARAFYYGGHKENPLYDETRARDQVDLTEANYREDTSVLNHFYEKLLLLKETMNTEAGKREAIVRTEFMQQYLERFYEEISEA